ncbi:FAD-dependent oxidoreductase [Sandaracinobacteroides hominis]|uniref:FAD-dependent oxidoreductase n=1 Tax=Sandaracinobacteroides hominis TaxID=2780086 RepID=UPI0018F320BB|nr:NAD(P)/FAD-dependent oxidoreductase [Sandaracinobacteroides hominis]
MQGLDIAIAGCGPCGLAAALMLQRAGNNVSLFERFESPQPIGSGLMLQPTGMAVLAELGLLKRALGMGSRVDRLFGKANERIVLDVSYSALRGQQAFGIGIHRASLFALLFNAAKAAAIPIHTGRSINGSGLKGNRRFLRFADGEQSSPFDLVVDALGTRTPLAPATGRELAYGALWASLDWPASGFDPHTLEQRYERASIMAGVLPIGTPPAAGEPQTAFFWSLRADRLAEWQAGGLAAWKARVAKLWPSCAPLLDQIDDPAQLTFARYAHRTLARPTEQALIHIGDAWHSASPQLGQGANMALLDAWALAMGLESAATVDEAVATAVRLRRRHVLLYQWLTNLFTPVYQSDSRLLPFVRDRLVGPVSRLWPATFIQAAMVSGLVGNPLKPLNLSTDKVLAE